MPSTYPSADVPAPFTADGWEAQHPAQRTHEGVHAEVTLAVVERVDEQHTLQEARTI